MRRRHRSVFLLACAMACAPAAFGLSPQLSLSQYFHTAWKADSGIQSVRRVKQTPDGYLWLATRGGLVRFDGVRFTTYQAGATPGLESSTIQDLLVDPDGSLWVATLGGGLAHYEQGKFRTYSSRDGLPSDDVASLYRDGRGVLWIGSRDGKIARLTQGRFETVPLAIPVGSITGFVDGEDQSLWISTFGHGVFRLQNGMLTAFSVKQGLPDDRVAGIYRDRSGKLWTTGWKGISSWDGVRFVPEQTVNKSMDYAIGCVEDRDGNLWIASSTGLLRAHSGEAIAMNRSSGLSADFAADVFEDREGDIWVGTRGGLDRLREGPVRRYTAREGSIRETGPIILGDSGAIWAASAKQIARVSTAGITTWDARLPAGHTVAALLPQPGSGLLIGFNGGGMRWSANHAELFPEWAGLDVRSLLQTRDGSVWIGTANRGLLHWKPSAGSRGPMQAVVPDNSIVTLAEDSRGVVWAGSVYSGVGLYRIEGGQVRTFGRAEGLESPYIYTIFVDDQSDLWAGTAGGLSWFQDGRIRTANARAGLPSDQVFAIVDDSYGRLWFAGYGGIAGIDKKSLTEWAAGRSTRLSPTVYQTADGVQISPVIRSPNTARSADGNLWFSFADGLSEVKPPAPGASRSNAFQVLIEDIAVDGGVSPLQQQRLRIPAGARSLEIAYTALTLSNPEAVRFRYRLEGVDKDWVEVGSRRLAFYNNLNPGLYKFRVAASAGGEEWREAPAVTLDQIPFFYQTVWFTLLLLTAAVTLGVLAYRVRVQQALHRLQAGFEERMDERARIAQELHDTVVQAIAGSTMLVENAAEKVPESLPVLKGTLLRAVDQLDAALAESRNALQGLRDTAGREYDLATQLSQAAHEINHRKIAFKVVITGEAREIHPAVRYEVFRIGSEALANAFKHSEGTSVRLELGYGKGLRMLVQDNGKGIPEEVLERGKDDHFGLQGIRERADRIGATLAIFSRIGEGTEVGIAVPEDVAFETEREEPSLFARVLSRLSPSQHSEPD